MPVAAFSVRSARARHIVGTVVSQRPCAGGHPSNRYPSLGKFRGRGLETLVALASPAWLLPDIVLVAVLASSQVRRKVSAFLGSRTIVVASRLGFVE
jgi:hypothetical protein